MTFFGDRGGGAAGGAICDKQFVIKTRIMGYPILRPRRTRLVSWGTPSYDNLVRWGTPSYDNLVPWGTPPYDTLARWGAPFDTFASCPVSCLLRC